VTGVWDVVWWVGEYDVGGRALQQHAV
jgi:hypothetical protein